ncbi:ABC transporter substrate-binding protein [Enterocloster asparagiformis]|uniref:ABC transporter, substrate-binding protein, family 5 n=3 Tax=Enterocloster asparagiformis TaxID=333367 RepID=C0D7C3_9FIRM|nr:ABC transporter substrate-binding protein [Enterocloster asparagiformis]EEG52770.1 ABC transporter, substrate-binding protein, family 5 [[Clostridium] asparagiforme DSM 15981]RGX31299.1 ABC transporter substrate-binding protein [Enterocloster asparagiformis]UWO74676.1 ABC transporter substrate-binding protein [[Clostridium] asparagiforme DSM 15981]
MKNNQIKERMAAFAAAVRKRPYAAAIAAAAVVLAALLFFVMGPPRIFSGIFRDQTGLAMVQEGKGSAVQKDEERRQVLRVYTNDATGVINPAYASSAGDRAVSAVIFEPLMRKSVDGKLEPVLARQVRMAEDGATCTIQLKKNIRFSDGQALTARDAAFSIAAMCVTAEEGSGPYGNIQGVRAFREGAGELPEGIRVTDELTVELAFETPSPDNLRILETKIQERPENLTSGFLPVLQQLSMDGTGTGAYQKVRIRDGSGIRLETNEFYRGKIRDIKAVEFVTYGTYEMGTVIDEQRIDAAFFSAESALFDRFFSAKQFTIYEKPGAGLFYMALNRNNRQLYIPAVRRAIALSIDRDRFAGGNLSAYMVKAEAIGPEDSIYAGGENMALNREKAKKLMEEAGEKYGSLKGRLRLPVLAGNKNQETLAKAVKSDLKDIGFDVDIELLDQAAYLRQVYMLQDFDLILSGTGGWDDPSAWDGLAEDMQGLPTACNSNELNAALGELSTAYSEKALTAAWKKAADVAALQVPVVPLARPKQFLAVSADLSGYRITRYDDFFVNIQDIRVK